jgi:hypothetical protein
MPARPINIGQPILVSVVVRMVSPSAENVRDALKRKSKDVSEIFQSEINRRSGMLFLFTLEVPATYSSIELALSTRMRPFGMAQPPEAETDGLLQGLTPPGIKVGARAEAV